MCNTVMGTPRDDFFEKKFLRGPPKSKNIKKKYFLPEPLESKKKCCPMQINFFGSCFDF